MMAMAAALLLGCGGSPGGENAPDGAGGESAVTVFAAVSLVGAMTEIAARFEERGGAPVKLSFAASSTLTRQIQAGAPADVFVSANARWMDALEATGDLREGGRADLLTNELALIVAKGSARTVSTGAGPDVIREIEGRLALGDPDHVPAGIYARQSLESLGLWDSALGRIIPAIDVREALRLVEIGEAAAGIVYVTDAVASQKVKVLARLPAASHDAIRYPAALVKGAGPGGEAFFEFLFSQAAREIFERHGFGLAADDAPPGPPAGA